MLHRISLVYIDVYLIVICQKQTITARIICNSRKIPCSHRVINKKIMKPNEVMMMMLLLLTDEVSPDVAGLTVNSKHGHETREEVVELWSMSGLDEFIIT